MVLSRKTLGPKTVVFDDLKTQWRIPSKIYYFPQGPRLLSQPKRIIIVNNNYFTAVNQDDAPVA